MNVGVFLNLDLNIMNVDTVNIMDNDTVTMHHMRTRLRRVLWSKQNPKFSAYQQDKSFKFSVILKIVTEINSMQ